MDKKSLDYYKRKLLAERESARKFILQLKDNDMTEGLFETSSELSFYDNHPADLASEMETMEKGRVFREHEVSIIKKIDDALKNIDNGTYGICKRCGKPIPAERLEFLPYAENCVKCQNELTSRAANNNSARPVEEEVLGYPFGYGYNDHTDEIGFDAEDSYQSVSSFNKIPFTDEYHEEDDDYVDPIERISNEQYRNQLPD
ncbi:MAG: yteA family sporulation protein [Clostridiales bacterium]|uniref:TraR/DksA C4-type zinc finger protein n=1 Tax=Clostridium sp. N3C TaxID=1776758 RepID=UPI00092DED26|nr:TraR/DksA C4-type zinc finger protein [Clostridium sp. N3C]NLZ47340.1 yteA family sporulation protein [Clostridiales bacterium]SCN21354.1 General stress protein 16O [Clostridium sp. N3C]